MGLFDNFFGGDSKDALREGAARSSAINDYAFRQTKDILNSGFERQNALLDPLLQSGQEANTLYDDLIGLNGPEARARAQELVLSDPALQGQTDIQMNQLARGLNASGRLGSGAAALAGQRVLQGNYNNALDRFMGRANRGQDATRAAIGIDQAFTGDRATLEQQTAANAAGISSNFASSMASQPTGLNNLLAIGGTVAKLGSAFMPK